MLYCQQHTLHRAWIEEKAFWSRSQHRLWSLFLPLIPKPELTLTPSFFAVTHSVISLGPVPLMFPQQGGPNLDS